MRAFIAIVPPVSVTESLRAVCETLRSAVPALRCEPIEKLHFTLEFLGEKEQAWLDSCRDAVAGRTAGVPPFHIVLHRIGFFPSAASPRILWAGSQPRENAPLCALAASLAEECTRLGHESERKQFHPHITLSRVKFPMSLETAGRITALPFEPLGFTCTELCFVQSVLHKHGSVFNRLYTIPLLG